MPKPAQVNGLIHRREASRPAFVEKRFRGRSKTTIERWRTKRVENPLSVVITGNLVFPNAPKQRIVDGFQVVFRSSSPNSQDAVWKGREDQALARRTGPTCEPYLRTDRRRYCTGQCLEIRWTEKKKKNKK